jgi:hypothetical protein
MLMAIPSKYAVAQVIGYIKGKVRSTSHEHISGKGKTIHTKAARLIKTGGELQGERVSGFDENTHSAAQLSPI